jgi:hypothetical protein
LCNYSCERKSDYALALYRWSVFQQDYSDGFIRPVTMYVPLGEKPIVWFSIEQFLEPTVTKGYKCPDGVVRTLNMDGLLRENLELFRIGVDTVVAPFR